MEEKRIDVAWWNDDKTELEFGEIVIYSDKMYLNAFYDGKTIDLESIHQYELDEHDDLVDTIEEVLKNLLFRADYNEEKELYIFKCGKDFSVWL